MYFPFKRALLTVSQTWLVLPAGVVQFHSRIRRSPMPLLRYLVNHREQISTELQAGRWLQPGDVKAMVVGLQVSNDKGWQVGDWLTLANGDNQEFDVQIVGILFDPITNSSVHLPLSTLQREWDSVGKVNTVWAQTKSLNAPVQTVIAKGLTQALEQRSIEVSPRSIFGENTIAGIIEQNGERNNIIIRSLAIMAVVIALVGGVGLSGVLSLSVLERRREIGVMRAISASSWQVIRLFVGEAMLLGLLSWLIALPLSIPAAYGLAIRGLSFALNQQLFYKFILFGVVAWLVTITLLAVLASLFPARGAARVSVRESLAYQ